MNLITPYDTETTGLPLFRDPSDDPRQPHLVDICILAFNADGTLVDSFEAMVRPDGWVIPAEVTAIHGITNEMAMDLGIPESEALDGFMAIHDRARRYRHRFLPGALSYRPDCRFLRPDLCLLSAYPGHRRD